MTNEEKVDSMLKFFHGSRTLMDLLLEMAELMNITKQLLKT